MFEYAQPCPGSNCGPAAAVRARNSSSSHASPAASARSPAPHRLVVLGQRAVVAHAARVVEQPPHRVELDRALAHEEEHGGGDGRLRDAVDRVPRIRVAGDLDVVADGDERGDAHASCQNSPVSPSRSRIAWFCSRVCGTQSGETRSSHQACASSDSFAAEIVAPGSRPPSQRAMCSSDRKRFIPLQVKTMSSHQCAAGTRHVEEERLVVHALVADLDRERLAAVGAGRLDPAVGVQRGADADRVPGAVAVPPAAVGLHPVGGRHDRERIEHPQLVGRRIEDEACSSCSRRQPATTSSGRRALARDRRATVLARGTRTSAAAARERSGTRVHVDFMIGSDEVTVSGVTRAGDELPLLVGGAWQI